MLLGGPRMAALRFLVMDSSRRPVAHCGFAVQRGGDGRAHRWHREAGFPKVVKHVPRHGGANSAPGNTTEHGEIRHATIDGDRVSAAGPAAMIARVTAPWRRPEAHASARERRGDPACFHPPVSAARHTLTAAVLSCKRRTKPSCTSRRTVGKKCFVPSSREHARALVHGGTSSCRGETSAPMPRCLGRRGAPKRRGRAR